MTQQKHGRYQSELALKKELNILRNDFYYQMIDSKTLSLVDFMYKPLDILSGDAYSARRIDEHRTFYLLVDGMGKAVSASFTAVVMTTFVNHLVDKMIENESFSLDILIQESMEYIKPILLDEEVLAIDYICFDSYFQILEYAKFAMPPFLLQDKNDNIIKIKSNNIPMSRWQKSYKIDRMDVTEIDKYLFYSDGIVENKTEDATSTYAVFIEEDFKTSFTREEFKEKFFHRIKEQEDDLSLIFINSLDLQERTLLSAKKFPTDKKAIDEANAWYERLWMNMGVQSKTAYKAGVVFTELFMNAYEHGNLGIDAKEKHRYLEEESYFAQLSEREKTCNKEISVEVYALEELFGKYIVTRISDEGEGFDTQILSEIFRNAARFNGRGVFVSRKNSMGIYYNAKGNSVLFLNKI
jgi:hypothetical protein